MPRYSLDDNELGRWFAEVTRARKLERFPNLGFSDEDPEEEYVAQELADSALLTSIEVSDLDRIPRRLIFVDGAMRFRVVGTIDVSGVQVPLAFAHIIAGAMRLEGGELLPLKKRDLKVVMFPFDAAGRSMRQGGVLPPDVKPIEHKTDAEFKGILDESDFNKGKAIFSDTTYTLGKYRSQGDQYERRVLIDRSDLVASGKVISVAKNRAKEIMRTLELALVLELTKSIGDEHLVIVDGPIAPLFKYVGLIDPRLRVIFSGLNDKKNASDAYDILKKMIGVVKKIVKIPNQLADDMQSFSLQHGFDYASAKAYVYLWTSVVESGVEGKEDDTVYTYVLSAFLRLRKELIYENYPVFSPTAGLVRLDVPLPVIIDDKKAWVDWIVRYHSFVDVQEGGVDKTKQLLHNDDVRSKLAEIINIVYTMRYPIPSSSPYRNLVELYPIREVEDWLRSQLLSKYDIATLGLS